MLHKYNKGHPKGQNDSTGMFATENPLGQLQIMAWSSWS